jgi:hypothetical protein
MPCFKPLAAFRLADGCVTFNEKGDIIDSLELPCGQCIGCRLEKSRQWATRCMHENSMHEHSSFITLTYDDKHLPSDGSLNHSDFQKFMKRLRKNLNKKLRFYMAGEYGETTSRPHYHAILFGEAFPDKEILGISPAGQELYTSATLSKIWGKGHCSLGEVTFESCAYVARYIMKKITGDQADEHYKRVNPETGEIIWLKPEYNSMSKKPGIGKPWYDKYLTDVYPHGYVVMNDVKQKPPKYYDKLFSTDFPLIYDDVLLERHNEAQKHIADKTDSRMRQRELCALDRLNQLKRNL